MSEALDRLLEEAGEAIGGYLPRIAGALAVLAVGLVAVRYLGRGLARLMIRLGLDRLAERAKVHEVLARAGLEPSLSRLIAFAVRLALVVTVILAAVAVLDLDALDRPIEEGVLFLPRLLAALALALLGLVLGSLARDRVERIAYQLDLGGPIASAAQWAVVVVFLIVALGELGVPTAILTALAGIIAASAALTISLAFGLGGRELAREVSAGRYVRAAVEQGQEVTIDGTRGEVVAIERAFTVLETENGKSIRIPNHLFLESSITVHGGRESRDEMDQVSPGDETG